MQAKKRQCEPGVIQQLIDAPQRFQFAQAVRILVRWLGRHGVPYEQAFTRVLRFQNSLSLGFPASEIEALLSVPEARGGAAGLLRALHAEPPAQIVLTPAFIGFLGVCGTLPLHHTERIADFQSRGKDAGARAFLDTFSHRMVALFCQAWGKYRLEHGLDTQGRDGQLPLLMALAGIRPDTFARRAAPHGVGEDVAGYYAALLRTRPISAHAVARVLAAYFGVPLEVEQFVGAWDYLPQDKRSTLGGPNVRLGYGATLGVRLWRHDLRVRLHLGPLDKRDFERFLPGGEGAAALAQMLALFGLPNLRFEVRLILSAPCVAPLVLTNAPGAARRLGWNTFLVGAAGTVRKPEVRYMLAPGAGDLSGDRSARSR